MSVNLVFNANVFFLHVSFFSRGGQRLRTVEHRLYFACL